MLFKNLITRNVIVIPIASDKEISVRAKLSLCDEVLIFITETSPLLTR